MAARTRSRLPVVLTVVGALVLGVGAVVALGYCSVFGCTVFSEDFEPDGEEAVAARTATTARLEQVGAELAADHPVLASTRLDDCVAGQNNWKRKDTYSHECFLHDSRVLDLAASREDVGPALTAFDDVLTARGCEASLSGGLEAVRREYWSEDNPNVAKEGAAGLPTAAYDCPGDVRVETVPLGADVAGERPESAFGYTLVGGRVLSGEPYDAADLAAVRRSGSALALVVTASAGYYRTEF